MDKLSILSVDFQGKRVVCRVDFNVPLDKQVSIGANIHTHTHTHTQIYIYIYIYIDG